MANKKGKRTRSVKRKRDANIGSSQRNKSVQNKALKNKALKNKSLQNKSGSPVEILFGEAVSNHQAGNIEAAIRLYQRVVSLNDKHGPAYNGLGLILAQANQVDTACELINEAIRLEPGVAVYHFNLGVIQQEANLLDTAIGSYRRAIALKTNYREAYENLGVAYQDVGNISSAKAAYREALRYNDKSLIALQNMGTLFVAESEAVKAEEIFERAINFYPGALEVRSKLVKIKLAKGDFEKAWKDFGWVYYSDLYADDARLRSVPAPKWDGSSLAGKTVLLYSDQGVGDEVMFASCLRDVIEAAENCIVECDRRLLPLFSRSFPQAELLVREQRDYYWHRQHGPIDYRFPIEELPHYFRPTRESYSAVDSYLSVDPDRKEYWRAFLSSLPGKMSIGVSWLGGTNPRASSARTIFLKDWGAVFSEPNINFINLQYGDQSDEIADFHSSGLGKLISIESLDPLAELDDFHALIAALDLVITIDNSTAHFAGAVGTPVWIMLPLHVDWRWQLSGEDCLWYDLAKLFRATRPGDEGKRQNIKMVATELHIYLSGVGDKKLPGDSLDHRFDDSQVTGQKTGTGNLKCIPSGKNDVVRTRSQDRGTYALLLNDTSNWYHWGCSCTTIAIHDHLRTAWPSVVHIPIYKTKSLDYLPTSEDAFDSDEGFSRFCESYPELVETIKHASAVYINGEGSLHDLTSQSLGLLYLAYVAKVRWHLSVHIINHSCYPSTSSATDESLARAIYRKVYSRLDTIAVREPVSAGLLASTMSLDVKRTFDCLPLFIEKHYSVLGTSSRSGDCGGELSDDTETTQIVIAGSVAWTKDVITAVKKAIKKLAGQGCSLSILMGASAKPAADDLRFIDQLSDVIGSDASLVNAQSELEWLRTIDQASLLISGRFHHTIAAAFLDTPFIVMNSNTPKIEGLLQMLEIDSFLSVDSEQLDMEIIRRAEKILENPEMVRVSEARKSELRSLALTNFEA